MPMTTTTHDDAAKQASANADFDVTENEGKATIVKSKTCAFDATNKNNLESSVLEQKESRVTGNELPQVESTAAHAENRDGYQGGELDVNGEARKKSVVDLAVIFPQKVRCTIMCA